MDDRDKRKIGEGIEPGGRPKAPGRLELLQRFVNTYNHDLPLEWDRIGDGKKAQAWLRQKRLVRRDERISDADAVRLREVREAIRALLVASRARRALQALSGSAQLTVAIDPRGRTSLEPVGGGVEGAIATLLGIIHEAQLSREWARLKACRECEYAFFDRSKNRSAAWCAMSICGNRTKNRAYYERRRGSGR